MQRAVALAQRSIETGGGPFGAVITRAGQVVGEGANSVVFDNDPTAHAEVLAIRDACRRLGTHVLDDCEIHTSCEPCPMCLGAIWWARLTRVHYACTREDAATMGFDDAELYTEMTRPLEARRLPLQAHGRDDATCVLEAWRARGGRTMY